MKTKIQNGFLFDARLPGCPGKEAVKQLIGKENNIK